MWLPSPPTSASATTSRFASRLAVALGVVAARPLGAQDLTALELGAGGTVLVAHHGFFGPELGVARRPGGQGRFALRAAGGDYEGSLGMRLQATAEFLLRPGERSGVGAYGGLGLAFLGAEGRRGAGYLTALVGVESAPGRRAGWYAELGLGGGVRLALGRRWRRLPVGW